jgi:hypothetical protein
MSATGTAGTTVRRVGHPVKVGRALDGRPPRLQNGAALPEVLP